MSLPFAIIGTAFVGYLYDILGRRVTLFLSFFIGSILIAFVPWTSPYVFPWLILVRIMIQLCFCAPNSSPLAADYIHSTHLGKGVAMVGIGIVLGEVFSMGVLFRITAHMSPEMAFALCGSIGFVFSFFFLFMVKEPQIHAKTQVSVSNAVLQPTTPITNQKIISFDESEVEAQRQQGPIETPRSSKNLPEDIFKQLTTR